MKIKDHISAKERLSNSLKKWGIREDTKAAIIFIVGFISFLFVITQPGGFI